jgi:hypothetical protein
MQTFTIVGTIAGHHTVAETKALVKDIDYQFNQVEGAFQNLSPAWRMQNPERYAKLTADWTKAKADWGRTKAKVLVDLGIRMGMAGILASENLVPAEDTYQLALSQTAQGGRNDDDSLYMTSRYITEINKRPIDYSERPSQLNTWDFDFSLYGKANAAVKTLENTVIENKGTFALLGLGIVAAGIFYLSPWLMALRRR